MKRLITILMSFIGCVSLFGQTVPMVVVGKVHMSGPVYSQGSVHLYASVDTGKIDIDNTTGAMLKTDHIVLYSNNTIDGLIRNLNTTTSGGGVQGILDPTHPEKVTVRKYLDSDWTYLSLPFNVKKQNVHKAVDGSSANGNVDYWAYGWDNVKRSDLGDPTNPDIWTQINYDTLIAFKQAWGYQIWANTPGEIDFVTDSAADIVTLFQSADKPLTFDKYMTSDAWKHAEYGAGWALIGSLSPSTYTLSAQSVGDYTGVVYYRQVKTSLADGSLTNSVGGFGTHILSINDPQHNAPVDIAPYAPFYIQDMKADDGSVPMSPGHLTGTFTYKTLNGLKTMSASNYRSVKEEVADQFKVVLSSDKNNKYDRFYLAFNEGYSETYMTPEDGQQLTTFSEEQPAVWTLLPENSMALVLNGLPMKDEQEIKVGFSVPEAGEYTFTAGELSRQKVKSIILVDNIAGKKIDLLQHSYTFTAEETVERDNGRFVLLINGSYTSTPSIEDNAVYAYAKDNLLTVKNLSEGDRVQVLDLAGRTIASGQVKGKEFSVGLNQKGIYVVNVKGGKTSILKVLNK